MAEPPKNMQPLVHAMVNLFFVLGEGSAFLRLYTKLFILNSPGWDDWAMLAVAIINCGQHALIYLFIEAGAGRSIGDVLAENPAAVGHMLKILFAEEMLYLLLHFFIKMSFLLFFLRLSPSTGFRRAVFAVIGLNVAVTVGSWALYCLQCTPIEAFWYPERHPGVRCLPFSLSLWLPASALIAVDWAIFLLPLSTILSLQMSTRRRVKVIAVVCTGGASVVVSCLRLVFLREFTVTTDLTYTLGSICIISAAEMEVAILAANMPGLSALHQTCKGAGLYPSNSRTARGPGRSSHPSGKGYIHTCDDAESSRDDSGNKGDGNCCCGGAGGSSSHRLATFSSRRLARGRAESGDDADLLYTRRDRRSEGRNPASDVKALANISTRELVAPSDEEVSSPGPAAATKGHFSSASSSSASSRRFQSGVVVSREVVITNELRTVGEGATMDGPEMAYYRPPAWKGAVRSSSRPP